MILSHSKCHVPILELVLYDCKGLLECKLEDNARYAGLLLAPAEGFGRGIFCPLGKKIAYYAVLAHCWRFLVFSSNLGNF